MPQQHQQTDDMDQTAGSGSRRLGPPDAADFQKIADHIKSLAGIHLAPTEKNRMLIMSRLQRLMSTDGVTSYAELIEQLDRGNAPVIRRFLCALTTNTTRFLREQEHFAILSEHVQNHPTGPADGKHWRIWCSPCSTGEEAYSIAITMERAGVENYRILATDIDEKALETAKRGHYRQSDVACLGEELVGRYTRPLPQDSNRVAIDATLKQKITFGYFNLLRDYPFSRPFDVIFCRNVLIYFERGDVQYVVQHMSSHLTRDGLLFLGHSEAQAGAANGLVKTGPAVFRRSS